MVPANATSILDVGCSNGALGASLREMLPGRRVTGIEVDADFAEQARQRIDEVICADLNTFDWASRMSSRSFDCIIFADVLEHLVDPPRQLRNAQSVLSPGGCMVISLPNVRHVSALYSIFLRGTFPRRDRGIFDGTHLRWFTIGDARRLVHDAGMRVEAMDFTLRVGDKGGGFLNKAAIRVLGPVQHRFPVREFLSYQFCIRAVR